MKQTLVSLLLALLPLAAFADAVEIDGIYYNLVPKAKVAEVTSNPNKYSGAVEIPDTVTYNNVFYIVSSIGNYAFYKCSGLTSVTIPNSVTSIGEFAFAGCNRLTYFIIPNSVVTIGRDAFESCSDLTSITIPNSVISIGWGAFMNCSGLTAIVVEGDNNIYDSREDCNAIVKTADNELIVGCTNTVIPNSVTRIGDQAFYGRSGLTSVTIPNSVTSIGVQAFAYCVNLTDIIIPNSVTSMGGHAFEETTWYNNLPDGLVYAGKVAYGYKGTMPNNTIIKLKEGTLEIAEGAFKGDVEMTDIIIPNSVTNIGEGTFNYCSGLTSVTLPNSVTSIGVAAFNGCSGLVSIIIGSGINHIRENAFSDCPELTNVYCYAESVPSTAVNAFANSMIEYATLYVPKSAIDAYKTTSPWSEFKLFMSIEDIKKCAKPAISFIDGELTFSCETEGVEFVYDIKVDGAKSGTGENVKVTPTLTVSVNATKDGYEKSETVTKEIDLIGTKGDVSGDGEVDATDITKLIDIILQKNTTINTEQ